MSQSPKLIETALRPTRATTRTVPCKTDLLGHNQKRMLPIATAPYIERQRAKSLIPALAAAGLTG